MTVNSATGAQTNNVNYSPVDVLAENTTDEQTTNRLRLVPYAQTNQSDTNLIANFNRARIEQRFQQENQVSANGDINGITTQTAFPLPVSEGETQNSVMRRAFEAMADRAGLSGESKQAFVESRMRANTNAEGKSSIFNLDKKPPTAYTDDEWAKMRSINFFPNDADIRELKQLKSTDNFNAGTESADEIIRALELGNRGFLDKLMSDTDASTELARALNKVRQNGANYDFQQGLLNRLGADRAVQLEEMLKDNFRYNSIIREAVSTTGMQLPDRQDRTGDIRREIAEKSSLEALVRITSDSSYPMDKNFLVGAGRRVMTRDLGWEVRAGGGAGAGVPVKYNIYLPGTQQIMRSIARNPEASLELLQDAEFVKNATILENSGENVDTISQIIRSGTSREMQQKNPDKVNNAVRVVSELIKEPNDLKGTSRSGLRQSETIVTERMANAMVDMFVNNPSSFVTATSMDNENGELDRDDFRKFVGAVRQHKGAMERLTAAVAIEYMKLVSKAEGGMSNVTRAGDLKGAFVDAIMQENVNDAKAADEERERLAKAIAIVGEVGTFYGLKNLPISEIPADLLGKTVAAVVEGGGKGDNVDRAKTTNTEILDRQDSLNAMTTVTVFEKATRERLSRQEATAADQEFLQALRAYNDSLSADEKILDANGQMINYNNATARQRRSIVRIFRTETNAAGSQTPLDKAVNILNDRMGATYRELRDATNNQLRDK